MEISAELIVLVVIVYLVFFRKDSDKNTRSIDTPTRNMSDRSDGNTVNRDSRDMPNRNMATRNPGDMATRNMTNRNPGDMANRNMGNRGDAQNRRPGMGGPSRDGARGQRDNMHR